MEAILRIMKYIYSIIWGMPLIVLIVSVGVMFSIKCGFIQIFKLPLALKYIMVKENGEGEISSFGALCTSLSATIGTGNIVGVAAAISTGGPGALFWIEIAALLGMATKYAEGVLAIKYRKTDKKGKTFGGPFYYIEMGMGKGWTWLGCIFAVAGLIAGVLGVGTIPQIHGITHAVESYFDPDRLNTISLFENEYSIALAFSGIIVTFLTGAVLIGGLKRITKVSEVVVPIMAGLYAVTCLMIMLCNVDKLPFALCEVVDGAFNPSAVTGGAVGSVFMVMQTGISRGVFSNEAGIGSAPIAASAARTKEPVRQGLVSMTGTFFDTICICTMTGLAIVMTGAWKPEVGLQGVAVTSYAFQKGLPFSNNVCGLLIMLSMVFFAFTTIIGWNVYSERCLQYLTGGKSKRAIAIFRGFYITAVLIGPYVDASLMWGIADICNGLMAFPNLIALFALRNVVAEETRMYFKRKRQAS